MKKTLVALLLGMLALSLVSCGNSEIDPNSISNKYPIENYLAKGATLQNYYKNGTAKLVDTKGEVFFAGDDSSYKVVLSEDGVVLPYIVVNGTTYYYDAEDTIKSLPESYSDKSRISIFGGDQELIIGENVASYTFIQYLSVFVDPDNSDVVYAQYKDKDNYQTWKTAEAIESNN